jgi:hypothetical protein
MNQNTILILQHKIYRIGQSISLTYWQSSFYDLCNAVWHALASGL